MRGILAFAVLGWIAGPSHVARAQDADVPTYGQTESDVTARVEGGSLTRVVLALESCELSSLNAHELLARLRVELVSDGVTAVELDSQDAGEPPQAVDAPESVDAGDPASSGASIVVKPNPCREDAHSYTVRIDDHVTRKWVERFVDLGEASEEIRLRALALAIAELLRSSWTELVLSAPPIEVPASIRDAVAMRVRVHALRDAERLGAPEPIAARSTSPATPSARSALVIAGRAVGFPGGRTGLFGGLLALDLAVLSSLVVRFDAEAAAGTAIDSLGRIDLGYAVGGVGAAYLARVGEVGVMVGARAAAGVAWAEGRPLRPAEVSGGSGLGPTLVAMANIEVDIPVHPEITLRAGLDGGAAIWSFDAKVGATPIAGLTGALFAVTGGVSFRL